MYDSLTLEHSSTVERAAEELRRAMFAGELEPGTPLREVGLADSLGVARSTVREALGLLIAEGLVIRVPNRGVAVAALDPAALSDVFRARTVLEEAGARAWAGAPEDLRSALRASVDDYARLGGAGADPQQLTRAHIEVHRAIAALTGSERLLALVDALHGEIRLTLGHVDRVRGNVREQVAAHRGLLELLERDRTEEVVQALREHLGGAETSLGAALRR
ncbi:hypothetical protein BH20ACT6_BH20ACT6_17330 [soil metagenome]